ncbi:hypothetical protein Hdeb2414_s0015g00445041 [Helianthus debilis subsp. tardiflorus]
MVSTTYIDKMAIITVIVTNHKNTLQNYITHRKGITIYNHRCSYQNKGMTIYKIPP